MKKETMARDYRWVLLSLVVLGLAAALIILPNQFRSTASGDENDDKGLIPRTSSQEKGLENFDIRENKTETSEDDLMKFRQSVGQDAARIADVKQEFVNGESELRTRIPSLKVEYSTNLHSPQVISPDVWRAKIDRLTGPSSTKRSEILRNFVKENNSLIGITDEQANVLKVDADYTNPNGYSSFARLVQTINGIPVYRAEVRAGFTKSGEITRVLSELAPGLEYGSLSNDFDNPVDAVKKAYGYINAEPVEITRNDAASNDLKVVFGNGDWATTAEKMYFPTEIGVARPSWRVLIWQPVNAYYVIVDAETGTMLSRENITADQTQPATYQIYGNPNAFINSADSPAPLTPGPIDPTLGTQGPLGTRTNVTRIGNEAPNPGMNNLGWITDGTNITDGNNLEAGIDRVAPNGVDAPQTGIPTRIFDSTWNPPPGNPAPGDDPLTAEAQRGAVIQMFYLMNLYHDVLYDLGFTEPARNFQNDNFGRGGVALDRVTAEGQDSSGTNNANFATPADGGRGRMQMFLWTGPTPDKDGTTDADVVIHEITHGTSTRLHNGLGNQGGMMGEGWSDWYAHTLLAEPTDPINGIYTTGGYATHLANATYTSNYFYGIRRFPKAVIAFTGGPNRPACNNGPCPYNPLTFRHINTDCDTTLGTPTTAISSAFPRNPAFSTAGSCGTVHPAGEIWSSALWEVRALMVMRLGFSLGTRRVLQVVTDGMKLAPGNPSMLQERDAIIMAASTLPLTPEAAADVVDVREGFRRRGMGFSATVTSATVVTEAFDFPNVQTVNPFSVSDSTGDNDGFPEPGENVLLSVAVTNTTGATVNAVMVNISGGANVSYGNIADAATVTMQIPFTVPAGATCGAFQMVQVNVSSTVGAQTPVNRQFRLGAPIGGAPTTFTNSTLINLPAGQPATTSGPGGPYPSNIAVSGLTGNKIIRMEFTGVTHTFPGDLDFLLVSPSGAKYIGLSDSGGAGDVTDLTFTLSDGAPAQPSTTQWVAGDFRPYNTGANDAFVTPAPVVPYTNAAPAATDTFLSSFGMNGTTMNGTWSLFAVDDAGGDFGTMTGWKLTFESDDYVCSLANRARADFDGDGRTDLSVFRPSEGNWYLNRSTAGFGVIKWGASSDTLTPGDYDGDNKTDTAVFRPDANPANPDFFVLNSNGFTISGLSWGVAGDIPVVADYDADGKTDIAVFRPSSSTWFISNSGGGSTSTTYGVTGDVPVVGDFLGDAKSDITVFRPSTNTWFTQLPAGASAIRTFGATGDILVPGNFVSDAKDDLAVFRPSSGTWFIYNSATNVVTSTAFGNSTDIPVVGDYNGDGIEDIAIYRNGQWWTNVLGSTSVSSFGLATDTPIVSKANP